MPFNILAFAAIAVPLVVTPGASTAVVLRNAVAGGTRAGVATALGTNAGSICYGLLTAFGVSVVLQRWPMVGFALQIGGAIFLTWLGFQSLIRARSYEQSDTDEVRAAERQPLARSAREGFVTNLLNPPLATFYLVILPEFIPHGAPFASSAMMLTAIHVSLAFTWHLAWAAAGGTLAYTLQRTWPRRILEAVTGWAMLSVAAKLVI